MTAKSAGIRNPLMDRDSELVERLAAFRIPVHDMLLDKLAATVLHDPACRAEQCLHPLDEVKATAQILRMLTKPSWDSGDFRVFDAFWRDATRSALFGEEFEAERHRIHHCVKASRQELRTGERALF
jgi:hypothetical protein